MLRWVTSTTSAISMPSSRTTNRAIRVWLNDGSGTFTGSGQTLEADFSFGVALGDLNGDGDPGLLESGSLTITVADLLANDDSDNGSLVTVAGIDTTGTTGSAVLDNGQVVYDTDGQFEALAAGETAIDTFTYTISDEHGEWRE